MNRALIKWLQANLGKRCLAPLTSTDSKALAAAVAIVELYAYDRQPSLLDAYRAVVMRMQPSTWHLAFHATASVMNWEDRGRIWTGAELPGGIFGRCECEPKFGASEQQGDIAAGRAFVEIAVN
ncbi:hypothetical protein [Anatilimnocola floriformis]|uniref:hypothetical protein n=1 Tax=Anatilimnocola floriformis TaxID=2948575 RepID=UPI0020C53980|nr:hypothetical protein [Anatilimnocola floriformis]